MLIYLSEMPPEKKDKYGVNLNSILVSISLSIAHVILEIIQLYFEALACKTSLTKYCVVCFNGRFGWVPFVDNMLEISKIPDDEILEDDLHLDYDDITYQNKFLRAKVVFKFSDICLSTLC